MDIGKMHRRAVESLYDGVCTVYEYQKIQDEETKLMESKEVCVLENQPCRVSFVRIPAASQSESASVIAMGTKLFIAPEIAIKPGSKITVTQAGATADYTCSSVPAVYQSHQEISLELFERWA